MASSSSTYILSFFLLLALSNTASSARILASEGEDSSQLLTYHKGPLLSGKISVNLIWYGSFKPTQRAIISDFISSLSSSPKPKQSQSQPSVSAWWATLSKYYPNKRTTPLVSFTLGSQIMDPTYSLGKSLTSHQIQLLASKGPHSNAVNVVLTADDVAVERFCMSTCGSHGSIKSAVPVKGTNKRPTFAYIWVGNSEKQCPGQCAWPFHQPIYGPQTSPLVAPNADVGLDGMVINLATLLAGTATNPFGNGYFQGPKEAPLEAASACPGVYGQGAYPGYAGNLLVDSVSGGSYNANGANGRKYLLPALFDPSTSRCSTLV